VVRYVFYICPRCEAGPLAFALVRGSIPSESQCPGCGTWILEREAVVIEVVRERCARCNGYEPCGGC
jgi:hypothetical protein